MVVVAACGKSGSKSADKSGTASGPGHSPVKGTVMVGGNAVTITKCVVESHMDTRISLVFDGGSLAYEDDHLYYYKGSNADGMMQGSQLTCESFSDAHSAGTSTDKPGWARGKLSANCSAPVPVKLDVELVCGDVNPEQQKDIDKMTKDMQDMNAKMQGGGSADGSSAGSAGSAN